MYLVSTSFILHLTREWNGRSAEVWAIKNTAKNIYLKINQPFKNLCNIAFGDALANVPDIGLTKSKTKAEKQKERL